MTRKDARFFDELLKFRKKAYARLNIIHHPYIIKLELTKTLPPKNIPTEKQFLFRYENLEQVALIFHAYKLRIKDTPFIWRLNNLWSEERSLLNNKSGIYLIHNKITKKNYVGKSSNLINRLENYCSVPYLEKSKNSSNIYRAIVKFGFQNFSFSVLEFCEEKDLNGREQHYINLIKPQYNIRKPTTPAKPAKPAEPAVQEKTKN